MTLAARRNRLEQLLARQVRTLGERFELGPDELRMKPPAEAALPPDLERVPGDAVGFVSLRVGEVWNQEAAAGLRERLRKEVPEAREQWLRVVGLPPGGAGPSGS